MTPADAEKYMKLATQSVTDSMKANSQMVTNNLDAADRILLRKAADVALEIARTPTADPT